MEHTPGDTVPQLDDARSPTSPTTKQRLFTPTSASKLLFNIYSHGGAGLRRKKALDTTACSDLTTNAHVDSPSTNVQREELLVITTCSSLSTNYVLYITHVAYPHHQCTHRRDSIHYHV